MLNAILAAKTQAMQRIRHIHMVGIGGSGMAGIAEVLLTLGYQVTGSDLVESAMLQRLRDLGAKIWLSHEANHVHQADVVVKSTAIGEENPEVNAARLRRIPVIPRAEMLAELMRFQYGIAVAGTHGKTTTTSLIASVLAQAKLDPTYVIGGVLNSAGSNAHLGESHYFVAEADESDASFLYLKPMIAVVTNIDMDHMQTYGGDFNQLTKTFEDFLHHLPFYGVALLCVDDPGVRAILPNLTRTYTTYGFAPQANIQAVAFEQMGVQSRFQVVINGELIEEAFILNMPGRHNVQNALATIAVARELGVDDATMREAMLQFSGVGRRFQVFDDVQVGKHRVTLVDDYGHHPRELRATIAAARQAWPDRRLVMVFQPHRYTRTRDLFNDFVAELSTLDELMLLEVYAASETPIPGCDGASLARAVRRFGKLTPTFIEAQQHLLETLNTQLHEDDVLIMQGAGNIGKISETLVR
jgi:UDP-N-acetylmuramate--alanine ligase